MSGSLIATTGALLATQAAIGVGVGLGIGLAANSLSSVLDQASRYIVSDYGTVIPNVVIEERGVDGLAITENPVEQGAAITDHAYSRPAELTMKLGWSNSSIYAAGSESYVREVYAQLLAIQTSRQPLSVMTGKRAYSSMLIEELTMTTDASTEYALMVDCVFKQIIIVSTSAAAVPPQANQAMPSSTAQTVSQGPQTPVATPAPSNESGISQVVGLVRG